MANELDDIVKGYQKKLADGYQPKDYSAQYEAIGYNLTSAYDAQFDAQKEQLNAQKGQLMKDYRQQKSDAYVTARQNALKNNEALAAHGLARDAYGNNSSGASEQSRVRQDAALLKNISALNTNQQRGISEIDKSIAEAEYQKNLALSAALSQLDKEKLTAQQQEDQFARTYEVNAFDVLASQQASQAEHELGLRELAEQQKQNEIANQLSRDQLTEQQKQNEIANQLSRDQLTEQQKQNLLANQLAQKEYEEQVRQNTLANELARLEFAEQQKQNSASNSLANAQLTEQQKQNAIANELARLEYEELKKQNTAGNSLASAQLAEQMKQNAYNNALTEIALYGEVRTDSAAAALGIAKGTKLTKNQLKALGVKV